MSADVLATQNRIDLTEAIRLFQTGDVHRSMHICQHLLAQNPNQPKILHLMGLMDLEAGRCPEAHSRLTQAISLAPGQADFHNDMGLVCMAMGQYDAALASFRTALSIQPDISSAHYNKGLSHNALGDHHSAATSFIAALRYDPTHAKAHFSLGDLLLARREFQGAERHLRAAIQRNPDYVAAYNHLSICLGEQERIGEARQLLLRALDADPLCASTHCNLGNLARQSYDFKEAVRCYREAIRLQPDFIEAHFNLSMVLLLLEDFESGWAEYEWRLRFLDEESGYPNRHGLPLWKGQSLKDKSILVYDEQGFGDVFMMSRYLMALKARGARVGFETRPELYDLFKKMAFIDEISLRRSPHSPATKFDYCSPLLSLPFRLGINRERIRFDAPYQFADPDRTSRWAHRIPQAGLKIGLAWRASNSDHLRSVGLDRFSVLSHLPGIRFYGLQKELNASVDGQNDWLVQLGPDFEDFSDTAAAIANLDLVITVDTVVAHLAGAMMKQVWVLVPYVPDWRWFLDENATPWYANMRLYRQPAPGDWDTPIQFIVDDLKKIVGKRDTPAADASVRSRYASAYERHRKKDFSGAESLYREILMIDPDHHGAASCLGLLYLETGRNEEALDALHRAILIKPDDALSMNNLGLALHRLKHFQRAIVVFLSAISCNPGHVSAYHNLGNLFFELGDLESTIVWYKKALDLDADNAIAQCEMGKLLLKKLDLEGAQDHFKRSIELSPEYAQARMSLATTALMQGDFATGWYNFQWRFKSEEMRNRSYPHRYTLPRWRGESFSGKRLLVHCEQGFGDTIQFSRFIPQVKKLGGEIIFQLQAPLFPLFRDFPGADYVEVLTSEPLVECGADLYVPLLDLPMCLGTEVGTIPAASPYLEAERHRIAHWQQYISGRHLKIGLAWSGNPLHINDHNRSCAIEHMLSICKDDKVEFYSLQTKVTDRERNVIAGRKTATHLGDRLPDFGETAAAITCLDLIITVDTAIAHLAAAMGKPTWVLLPYLPDWRWMIGRDDSPWYPTLRLFRQPEAGDWTSVTQAVRLALEKEFERA